MARTDYAELWDTPDAKRQRAPGKWDVYCAQCGHFVDSVASPVEPHSVRCRRCRERDDPWHRDTPRTCSRCGERGRWLHIDGEGFVCDECLSLPVGHVAVEAPQSAPERTSAADGAPHDAEAQGGAARGSDVQDALRALSGHVQRWVARELEATRHSVN